MEQQRTARGAERQISQLIEDDEIETQQTIGKLAEGALQPPPHTGADDVVPFLHGLAALGERMVMVLDLERLGAAEQVAQAA
jgi:purine-binding chemotaxis protein CheW